MTRYFMRDTPLCQLEQQMMTPPNFKPRGHGRYSPGFQYSSEDTECPYCINFRRNQPCPLKLCICLDERIAAGALNLNEFVRDCFFPEAGVQLQARLWSNNGHTPDEMADLMPRMVDGIRHSRKIGRNEPCPCGSGKKYKKCCGR